MDRTVRFTVLVSTLLGLLAVASAQQLGTAGIYGTVYDPQGGIIPGAQVTLTHLERNQTWEATTNNQGQYAFPLIPVGSYRISVRAPGFKLFEQTGIVLQVNDNRRVDATLEVGDIATRVVVEAAPVAVETSSATVKTVVDGKRVLELPLNGRNVLQLGLLVPGTVSAGGGIEGGSKVPADNQKFVINGSRQNNVRFTLDGGDNQDNLTNVNAPYPFPDAVEEFSVQTVNPGAEIGKSSAGAVNVVTKSGTNEFHGSGFWFVRNSELNATSYFLHQSDNLKRNQAGFTSGGPIRKNRLFFFGGIQRTWIRRVPTESRQLTMPAAHRKGDFSDLLQAARPVVVNDPETRQPFPGNIIPASRLSPAAQNLLKLSPLPGPDGYTYWRSKADDDLKEYVLRMDWRPSSRHSLLGRYLQNTYENVRPFDPNNLHSVTNTERSYSKNATLGYTLVLSPSTLADTHFTVSRTLGKRWNDFPYTIASFGVKVNPSSNQISVSINGTSGLSLSTVNPPARFARTNLEWTHSWRWIKGRHSYVTGVDLMFSRYNEYNFYLGAGSYGFNGRWSGFDQADYVLGLLSSFQQSNGEIEFRRYHYQGFYFADTFRVARRLTLNYGLRWEPYTPLTDLNDRVVQFRPEEYARGTRSQRYVNAPPGLLYPGDVVNGHKIPKGGVDASKKQFAPRVGLAYDLTGDGRMSVRAGYGLFYDSPMMYMLNNMNVQAPFSFTVAFTDGLFDDPYRGRTHLNVFPFAGDFDRNSPFQLPFQAVVYESRWNQPYTQTWNFTIERTVATWLFQISYVGTKGTHLTGNYDINAPIYDYSRSLRENQTTINQRRPRKEYQKITTLCTALNSTYHGLQVSVNKRFSRGFSVQSAYTFSRTIDQYSTNKEVTTQNLPNPFDFRFSRGLSDFDITQRWVTSYVWTLPRPGKALGAPWLGWLTDGWQFSGIVGFSIGTPFTISATNDAMAGAGTPRVDLIGDLFLPSNRSRGERIARYFNTSAVANPQGGAWGTLGRNVIRNPNGSSTDVAMTRVIPLKIRENLNLMFRSEFFSLFNHPQLGGPDARIGRTTFGQITSVGGQRVLQFSLKLNY